MIEIRHDEILEPYGVVLWADRLARCLEAARSALRGEPVVLGATSGQHTGELNG
jgi:predicted N-formylglutamate amidohydrolase